MLLSKMYNLFVRTQARIHDFTLGGALLGEGFGDRLAPQRVQDSARGRSPWELENIGPLF
jgi:hypothetical protein